MITCKILSYTQLTICRTVADAVLITIGSFAKFKRKHITKHWKVKNKTPTFLHLMKSARLQTPIKLTVAL